MKPKYGTSPSVFVAVCLCCPCCSVPGRASRRPWTPNQHDTAQVTLISLPLCFHSASQFLYACMHVFKRSTYPFRTQADVPWHLPVVHDRNDSPFTDHALVMRQPVSIALHAALVQRRKAWLRNAATQGVALSSSTSQCAPSSGPDCGPTLAAGAAVQEPLARHDLISLSSESRTGRVRPRISVPDEHD